MADLFGSYRQPVGSSALLITKQPQQILIFQTKKIENRKKFVDLFLQTDVLRLVSLRWQLLLLLGSDRLTVATSFLLLFFSTRTSWRALARRSAKIERQLVRPFS